MSLKTIPFYLLLILSISFNHAKDIAANINQIFYIEKINVSETVCEPPTNIGLSNIKATTIDLSWDESGSLVNAYEWVVMAAGDSPDINTAFASGTLTSGTTNTSINNLNDDTSYDLYMRTLCANSTSNWSIFESFTTQIAPAQINLFLYTQQSFNSGNGEADALGINFKPDGNNGVDAFDAGKLPNIDENLARFNNGSFISIENRAMPVDNESLMLNVWNFTTTNYIFLADVFDLPEDIDAYIVDRHTGDWHKIKNGTNQINFSVDNSIQGSMAIDRFSINFDVNPCSESSVWSGTSWNNGLPNANTKALITNDFTEFGTIETCDLEVRSNTKLKLKGVLHLNGELSNDGEIIFKSDINGSGQIGSLPASAILADNITVERFIPVASEDTRAFRFLTSTVDSNASIFDNWQEGGNSPAGFGTHITGNNDGSNGVDQTITGNPSMYTFDNSFTGNQSNAWEAVTDTKANNLVAGEAYRIFIRGDRNYDLTSNPADAPNSDVTLRASGLLAIGNQTQTLSDVSGYYSMIGNPYQANVDISSIASTNINSNFYYIWDPNINGNNGRGGYVTVDIGNNSSTGTSTANKYVMPGQSFFVQTVNNGSADITFNESDKAVNASFTSAFSDDNEFSIDLLLYNGQSFSNGENEADAIVMNFNPNGNNAVDLTDASKIGNPGENLARLNNGNYLSIENRAIPAGNEMLELYTDGLSASNYTFIAQMNQIPESVSAYLVDHYTDNQTLLSDGNNQINFTVDANVPGSIATDRFSIQFEIETFGIDDNERLAQFEVYPNPVEDGNITIQAPSISGEAKITLYNMMGQEVMTTEANFQSSEVELNIGSYQAGVYFIEVSSKGQTAKERLIIK